ncbi:glycosyltransferase [Coraliomargarita sp. W4R53]
MKILFASHTHMMPDMVVGSHHLARSMSQRGIDVTHMSVPWSLGHLLKQNSDIKRRVSIWKSKGYHHNENLLEYIPLVLWPWAVSSRFIAEGRNPHLKYFNMPKGIINDTYDLVLIDDPRFFCLKNIIKSKRWVYRATDIYSDITEDPSRQRAEDFIIDEVDKLIATSEPVASHLRKINSKKQIAVFENGVNFQHFCKQQKRPTEYIEEVKRIVYVGAIDARLDVDLLKELALICRDVEVVVIGKVSTQIRIRYAAVSNLRFLGPINYERVPGYIQHADVAVLPLSNHPANAGRSPMKLNEYLAAGVPVVARKTLELARREMGECYLYETSDEFVYHVKSLLKCSKSPEACRMIAKESGWDAITDKVLDYALS